MKGRLLVFGALFPAALLVSGAAAAQDEAETAKYIMSPASAYKGKIAVSDNPAANRIVVSSLNAWQAGDDADAYLGATIDKSTKAVRYFTYQTKMVVGDWAGYTKAELATPTGPVEVKVTYKNDKIIGCAEQCTMQEVAGFMVDRALLDQVAARKPSPDDKLSWQLISSKGKANAPGVLSVGEIAAFLAEVDTQRRKK